MEDPWKVWKRQREAAVLQKENLKERVKIEEPEEVTEFVEESKEDLRKSLRLADNEGEMAPMGARRDPIAPQNEAPQGKPARGHPEEPIGSKSSLLDCDAFRQWVMERGRGKRNAKPSLSERKIIFDCFLRAAESLTPPFNGIHLLLQFKRLYNIEEIHRHFGYHKVAEFIQSFPEFFDQGDGYFKFRTQEDDSIVKERILNVAHQLLRPFKESQFCGLYKQIYGDRDAFRTLGCKSLVKALMTSKLLDRVGRSKDFYLKSGSNQQSAAILKGERMVQQKKAKQNSRTPQKNRCSSDCGR